MYRVTKYVKYEGASNEDFVSLEDATTYFEEVKAELWHDDCYKVELVEYTTLATASAE